MSFEAFNDNDAKQIVDTLQTNLSEEDFVRKYADGSVEKLQKIYEQNLKDEKIGGEIIKLYGNTEFKQNNIL